MAWNIGGPTSSLGVAGAGGMPDFNKVLKEGFEAAYTPKNLAEKLLAAQLANKINKPYADNADKWFQADLNKKSNEGSLIGQQIQEAMFYNSNPTYRLLKAGGPAAQVAAIMLLQNQQKGLGNGAGMDGGDQAAGNASTGGGYHTEGGGSGFDLPRGYFPAEPSHYANEANQKNPTLDAAINSLPEDRRRKFEQMFAENGISTQGTQPNKPMQMTLTKKAEQPPNFAKMLEDKFKADLESTSVNNNWKKALTETAGKRASTSLTKLSQELQEVNAGYLPGTNGQHRISPEQQEELRGQYKLQMQKHATDTDTRKKALFASNIDKTIDSIDTKDLTRFAGPRGATKLRAEELKSALKPGSESEEYRRYLESANKAKLMSKQVRQFYGDSIQPEVRRDLEKLSNPATWRNNPEIATRLFNSFTGLLRQETGTYRGALKNTKEFEAPRESSKKKTYNLSSGRFE